MISPHRTRSAPGWATLVLLAALGPATATPAQTENEAESLSTRFREAARRVLPAVVTVRPIGLPPRIDPRLPALPGGLGPDPSLPTTADPGGSGVVIDAARGLVLTNDHVIREATRVVVTLPTGREREARQIRRDTRSDLALITIDADGLQQADWGDSEALDIGDWVLAIGQPFGLSGTVTSGIVSSTGRGLGAALFHEDLIQTDAAINPGNSGGPLVNLRGEVVGISLAFKSLGGGFEGVGFAVPASRARRVASDLAEFGEVRRSYLGIEIRSANAEEVDRLDRPGAVAILAVASGSPADQAGILPGDMVLDYRGEPVRGAGMLKSALEFATPGEEIALTIDRDGRRVDLRARPQARPAEPAPDPGVVPPAEMPPGPATPPDFLPAEPPLILPDPLPAPRPGAMRPIPAPLPGLGARLEEMTTDLRRKHGLEPADSGLVVVDVEPEGPAAQGGLEPGMVVTDAAGRRVNSLDDLRAALAARPPGRDLLLRVRKDGRAGFRVIVGVSGTEPRPTAPEPGPRAETAP